MSELKERIEKCKQVIIDNPTAYVMVMPLLDDCQSEIERLERQLEAAETALIAVTPPNRKSGECYCPVGRNIEFGHSHGCKIARGYFAQSQKGSK